MCQPQWYVCQSLHKKICFRFFICHICEFVGCTFVILICRFSRPVFVKLCELDDVVRNAIVNINNAMVSMASVVVDIAFETLNPYTKSIITAKSISSRITTDKGFCREVGDYYGLIPSGQEDLAF